MRPSEMTWRIERQYQPSDDTDERLLRALGVLLEPPRAGVPDPASSRADAHLHRDGAQRIAPSDKGASE